MFFNILRIFLTEPARVKVQAGIRVLESNPSKPVVISVLSAGGRGMSLESQLQDNR